MSLTSLLDACRRLGITPDSFEGLPPGADIERLLLEEAIRLRDADQSALSLTLLDLAVAHGFSSGWVDDNRARALLDLGRRDEARSLWLALNSHVDLTLRAVAERMLQQLKLDEQLPLFLVQVQDLADQHQWTLERVSDQQTSSPDVEFALLEEVILAREKGAISLSLELVDLALQAGFSSPWLHDNRARSLVAQERLLEACSIWRDLLEHEGLDDMRSVAEGMLSTYRRQEQQALQLQRENHWLDQGEQLQQQGDLTAAINQLVCGLLEFPDSTRIETYLIALIGQRRQGDDPQWCELSLWLQQQELSLECQEEVLRAFEQRLVNQRSR